MPKNRITEAAVCQNPILFYSILSYGRVKLADERLIWCLKNIGLPTTNYMTAKQNPEYLQKINALEALLLKDNVLLTRQELKVLYAAIEGKTNHEIAEELGTSLCTIKTHKNRIITKLGLKGKVAFQKYLLKMAGSYLIVQKINPKL